MDSYNDMETEASYLQRVSPKVKIQTYNNGKSIHFEVTGLSEYDTSKLHESVVQQSAQIRQLSRESQLIGLVALSQVLLFLITGFTVYGQFRAKGGNNQQSSVQHQSRWQNRV